MTLRGASYYGLDHLVDFVHQMPFDAASWQSGHSLLALSKRNSGCSHRPSPCLKMKLPTILYISFIAAAIQSVETCRLYSEIVYAFERSGCAPALTKEQIEKRDVHKSERGS
jgi:hypothetical protein